MIFHDLSNHIYLIKIWYKIFWIPKNENIYSIKILYLGRGVNRGGPRSADRWTGPDRRSALRSVPKILVGPRTASDQTGQQKDTLFIIKFKNFKKNLKIFKLNNEKIYLCRSAVRSGPGKFGSVRSVPPKYFRTAQL